MSRRKNEKKHKLIRKGHGKEPTVIEFNLSKAVILLIIIGVIIAGMLTKEIVTTIIETKQTELLANEEEIDVQNLKEVNGDLGYITSAEITSVKTGVGPFDDNDEPGNDSSEDNNIVRSFDQVTWTVEATMGLKPGTTETSLKGGIIEVEASLPENLANIVEWDLDSMLWFEEANISEDGVNLTGKYTMSDEEITIPGKTNLVFVLQVKNATQGTEIQPTFTVKLAGNEETEKITKIAEKIIVSATGKYNIALHDYTNILADKTTVDYGEGNVEGRMYGYGLIVQLYNESESKGFKGLEYNIDGEINFDIDLTLESVDLNSTEVENITNEVTPILWNYRENKYPNDLSGNIEDRDMFYNDNYLKLYDSKIPTMWENKGDIEIVQENNILHVTINVYDNSWLSTEWSLIVGAFFTGYMQIFVPNTEESDLVNKEYYFTVSDNNMNIVTNSGEKINNQINTTDDKIVTKHEQSKVGVYNQDIMIEAGDGYGEPINLESYYGAGDGKANINDLIWLDSRSIIGKSNDYDIYTVNKFIKYDGEAFEPMIWNGNKYITFNMQGNAVFNAWYVTKPDGTNWTSQEEMDNTNIEDMELYENIEDILEGKICVGMYFENISGYLARSSGDNNNIYFPVKIKDTAQIGKTYAVTVRTTYWKESLNRDEYTVMNLNVEWPEPEWDSGNFQYIKTEYDEKGEMKVNQFGRK